jgi:hypothetical protein
MKNIIAIICLIMIPCFASSSEACNNHINDSTLYVVQNYQQPQVLQVMVYQIPQLYVAVPVVIQTVPVVQQPTVWTLPYQPVFVPPSAYQSWGYDRRCLRINRY